jgi:hypothetical protein
VAVGGTEADPLTAAERYERLYSAAARMLAAQGPVATRAGWPAPRRQRWHDLELLLSTQPLSTQPLSTQPPAAADPTAPDPSVQLASRLDPAGRPVGVAAAVRDWERRLAVSEPTGGPVVLPGLAYAVVTELLEELAGRLAPGRPVGAVGDGGAAFADLAAELADGLRVPAPGMAGAPSHRRPSRSGPEPRPPRPLTADPDGPLGYERLARAARLAAEATPAPGELDLAVRHEAAVAAADLLAGLGDVNRLGWRERHADIRPDVHLVSRYRFDGSGGRPVGLAERAAELRAAMRGLRAPWRPAASEALPASTPQAGWIALPDPAADIIAELLDELAARMRPGRRIGTIHFTTYPVQAFIGGRLRRAAIGI